MFQFKTSLSSVADKLHEIVTSSEDDIWSNLDMWS